VKGQRPTPAPTKIWIYIGPHILKGCFVQTRFCLRHFAKIDNPRQVVIDAMGDDNIVMSVDYPHADGPFPHGLETFLALPGVSTDSKRKIMWDNCLRLYGLSTDKLLASS
jgi:hypothetical protein